MSKYEQWDEHSNSITCEVRCRPYPSRIRNIYRQKWVGSSFTFVGTPGWVGKGQDWDPTRATVFLKISRHHSHIAHTSQPHTHLIYFTLSCVYLHPLESAKLLVKQVVKLGCVSLAPGINLALIHLLGHLYIYEGCSLILTKYTNKYIFLFPILLIKRKHFRCWYFYCSIFTFQINHNLKVCVNCIRGTELTD